MANNRNADIDGWVSERLTTLSPDSEFRPNSTWAMTRYRKLRADGNRREHLWLLTVAVAFTTFLFVFTLPPMRAAAQRYLNFGYAALPQSTSAPDRPEYAGGKLVRPKMYREWIYLSSGLGMEYNAASGGPEKFTNVFVPQWAYREFMSTGKWPDKSMFVLETRASQTKGSINKTGHFQSDLSGITVEVKDETRFPSKWAYFIFGGDVMIADAMTGPNDACWRCHDANAAVEHTFVQFYPTLKPVAIKFGTYKAQAE